MCLNLQSFSNVDKMNNKWKDFAENIIEQKHKAKTLQCSSFAS